eukprot:Hpha_TRINITY_DN11306_c0_g2::TRINITY_DN11306_c0_g2_i1::g.63312::m.63312
MSLLSPQRCRSGSSGRPPHSSQLLHRPSDGGRGNKQRVDCCVCLRIHATVQYGSPTISGSDSLYSASAESTPTPPPRPAPCTLPRKALTVEVILVAIQGVFRTLPLPPPTRLPSISAPRDDAETVLWVLPQWLYNSCLSYLIRCCCCPIFVRAQYVTRSPTTTDTLLGVETGAVLPDFSHALPP